MHQKLIEYASTERPWVSILSRAKQNEAEGLGASKKIVEKEWYSEVGTVTGPVIHRGRNQIFPFIAYLDAPRDPMGVKICAIIH